MNIDNVNDYEFVVELSNGFYLYPLITQYYNEGFKIPNNIYYDKITVDYNEVKIAFINLINNSIYFDNNRCKYLNENNLIITDEEIIISHKVCTPELVVNIKNILYHEVKIYCKKEKQICKKRYICLKCDITIRMSNIMKKSKYIIPFINYSYKNIEYKYSTFKNNIVILFLNEN